MAKLTRQLQKIFGETANLRNEITAFGTTTETTPIFTDDISTIQTNDYSNGWFSETSDGDNRPFAEDRNAIDYLFSRQLKYLFQAGLPEWIATETYYIGAFVRSGSVLYVSIVDNNLNNNPTTTGTNYWIPYNPAGDDAGLIGEIKMYAGIISPSPKFKICDGSEISRTTYSTLFTRIGTYYGSGNGSTTFNIPDFRGRVPFGASQVGDTSVLGYTFGILNHSHTIPAHRHNNLAFTTAITNTSNGAHTHSINDPGHIHNIQRHLHGVRYSDYDVKQGGDGNTLKLTDVTQDGGYSIYSPANTTYAQSQMDYAISGISIPSTSGSHTHSSFSGYIGSSDSNAQIGDNANSSGSSNPPSLVVNYIIKVL